VFTAAPSAISAVPPLRNRPHTAMLKVPRCMRRVRSRSGLAGQPKVLRPIAQSTRNRQPSLANCSATPIPNHIALLETSTAFRSRWFSFVMFTAFLHGMVQVGVQSRSGSGGLDEIRRIVPDVVHHRGHRLIFIRSAG
jgi:hypothetical protein